MVTGGSSGIGRAILVALAQAGAERVLVHYRRNLAGAEHTAALVEALGCQASCFAADLAVLDDRDRLVEYAFDHLGEIQTWVNNAGADVLTGDAAELDFQSKLRWLMEVDLLGTIELSRRVADRMQCQQSLQVDGKPLPPSISFLGWDQATEGMEGDAGQMFAPVKAAVIAYAAALAQSLAPQVRVNCVCPGWIRTSWGESTSPYWDARAKSQSLMQRWGRGEDVARAILYLADPENTFTTGQTINVNGGWNRVPRELDRPS